MRIYDIPDPDGRLVEPDWRPLRAQARNQRGPHWLDLNCSAVHNVNITASKTADERRKCAADSLATK